jgi:hypothetical protein
MTEEREGKFRQLMEEEVRKSKEVPKEVWKRGRNLWKRGRNLWGKEASHGREKRSPVRKRKPRKREKSWKKIWPL